MKVEPQQWYYDTDRLGLLVWQDMPAMVLGKPTAAAQQEFLRELHAIVEANIDHPSIVQWVLLHRGVAGRVRSRRGDAMTCTPRSNPPDRYHQRVQRLRRESQATFSTSTHTPAPASKAGATQAIEDGEFGGLAFNGPASVWPGETFSTSERRTPRSRRAATASFTQVDRQARQTGLSGAIYTAATDVDDEVDGLITFDRRELKVTPALVRAINARAIADGSRAPASP